jgi:hypothetical protein
VQYSRALGTKHDSLSIEDELLICDSWDSHPFLFFWDYRTELPGGITKKTVPFGS